MRNYYLFILLFLSCFGGGLSFSAERFIPLPQQIKFPNIKQALDDGFYTLAEQQARSILKTTTSESEAREATLFLAHALWGKRSFIDLSDLMNSKNPLDPGFTYWKVRAYFELKQDIKTLKTIRLHPISPMSVYAPSILRIEGRSELRMGELKKAEELFRLFAKKYPTHPEYIDNQFDLAEVLMLQKQISKAVLICTTLSKSSDKDIKQRARIKQARLLYLQSSKEDFTAMARTLLTELGKDPTVFLANRIDAYIELAALEEKVGNKREAIDALQQAAILSPDAHQRVPIKLSIVQMLLKNNDTTGALKLLEQCRTEAPNEEIAAKLQLAKADALFQLKRYPEATDAYQIYLDVATNPFGLAHAYFGKGMTLLTSKHYAEAAASFDKAIARLSDSDKRANALIKAGDAYYQAQNFLEAAKRYQSFITDFKNHENIPLALYQLGVCFIHTDRSEKAIELFKRIETDYPKAPFAEKAALRTANILRDAQQWEKALEKFVQIQNTYTNSPNIQSISEHQRGLVLYQLGRYSEAQKAFETVLKNYPKSKYAPQSSYMRGFCIYYQGQTKEAIATCQAYIKNYPDSKWTPEVLFWIAEQYYNQGDYKTAEPFFLRITTDFKNHALVPRALYWAGKAAAAQANYVSAIERYGILAKNYPNENILHLVRFAQGDALTQLGEFSRAILAFEEIIKTFPESPLVNNAWGRKGDCQFVLASNDPAQYAKAISSYQSILDRDSAPLSIKLQAEYKIGRCFEKTNQPKKAFEHYTNVIYTFLNKDIEYSPYSILWFTRAAFGSASIKEQEKAWLEATKIYQRVIEANVPSKDEAKKRIEKIKKEHWLLFQQKEGE